MEGAMDEEREDKSLVEKTIEAIKDMASSVTGAAKSAMDPKPDPVQVAGTTNEQVYVPEATDPVPLIMGAPPAKRKRKAPVKPALSKIPPEKAAAKKSESSAGRKAVGKKTARRVATKKTKR
jgi:hypothetical protein